MLGTFFVCGTLLSYYVVEFFAKLRRFYKSLQNTPIDWWYSVTMVVYIEIAFADNFAMDLFLLVAAASALRLKPSKLRLLGGAAVGAIGAVVSVYLKGFWLYVCKILLLVIMCATVVGFCKSLVWYILATAAYTFISGGCIVALFNLFDVPYSVTNGTLYKTQLPLCVYFAALALVWLLTKSIVFYVSQVKKIAPYVMSVKVAFDGKVIEVRAFRDSGNTVLYDGLPVCFVVGSIKNFDDYFAKCVLSKRTVSAEVSTVTGTKYVPAVPATVVADGAEKSVYLALPAVKCPSTYYEIIMPAD